MDILKDPVVLFQEWRQWRYRPRLSDCMDVPASFDVGGLYLFAHFPDNGSHPSIAMKASHMMSEVIYIGMSKRLTGRTQSHEKITRLYKTEFKDMQCERLYFSHCDLGLGWGSWDLTHRDKSSVKLAFIRYAERKLLWEYAREFGRLPSLNME